MYRFRGMKSDVWEGGHRVAFLARWPYKVEAESRSDRLVCLNDLLATCAELTGQSLDWNAGEDSFSFLSALTGESNAGESSMSVSNSGESIVGEASAGESSDWQKRRTLVNQAVSTVISVRQDNWKLILDMSSGGWSKDEITDGPPMQLYNLDEDIGEQNNLYETMPDKVAELEALLEMFKKEGRSRFK